MMNRRQGELFGLLIGTGLALLASAIEPTDWLTWWMEVLPVLIGVPVLFATYARFPFTMIAYRLVFVHALVLIFGGHYTYADVPPGFWLQDVLDLSRNHYDRFAHFVQGFVPAIVAREILIRRSPLRPGAWLFFLVTTTCLALSAFYELIEWWAAMIWGATAEAFLGTQGDVWDTQWDMFFALVGAITSLTVLGGFHDRALARLPPQREST